MSAAGLACIAMRIADAAVVADIESYGVPIGGRVYDVSPMLDPREHAPQVVDMAREAIDYALERGLVQRLPQDGHLRVVGADRG